MTTVIPKVEMSTFADIKRCPYCKQSLSIDSFTKNNRYSDGLQSYCKECMKRYRHDNKERMDRNRSTYLEKNYDQLLGSRMQKTYGISLEQYQDMLQSQGGCCSICGSDDPGVGNGGKRLSFSVDHDHNCCPGKKSCGNCVRGLLCAKCNLALGLLGDSVPTLMSAIQYLQESN